MHRIASWEACRGNGGQYQLLLHHPYQTDVRLSTITFDYNYGPLRKIANFGGAIAVTAAIEHAGKLDRHRRVIECIGAPAIGTLVRMCYQTEHSHEVPRNRPGQSTLEFVGGAVFVQRGVSLRNAELVGHERVSVDETGRGHVVLKVPGGEVCRRLVAAPWAMTEQAHESDSPGWLLIPTTRELDNPAMLYAAVDPMHAGDAELPPWLVQFDQPA